MSRRVVYIISDLHMGGKPPEEGDDKPIRERDPGFQMFPKESQKRLVQFIEYLCKEGRKGQGDASLELVINGDIVDFLAEENPPDPAADLTASPQFDAFTQEPEEALKKFKRIVERNQLVFSALQKFCEDGHRLTMLLGNHDLELATPIVRKALLDAVTKGKPALVEFIYDGQAYQIGDLWIDHGNRNDGWNLISHDSLRRYRSARSRGEMRSFQPPPGSHLVVDVMNSLKQRYRFLDLLKPENEAVLPILVALEPKVLKKLYKLIPLAVRAKKEQPNTGQAPHVEAVSGRAHEILETWDTGVPTKSMQISGGSQNVFEHGSQEQLPVMLQEFVWSENDSEAKKTDRPEKKESTWDTSATPSPISGIAPNSKKPKDEEPEMILEGASPISLGATLLGVAFSGWTEVTLRKRAEKLRKAFLRYRDHYQASFDLLQESSEYEEAARSMANVDQRKKTVVFGHTHLAKKFPLNNFGSTYLNTGTWCPIIRLPERFYLPSDNPKKEEMIIQQIKAFLKDLRANQTQAWCQLIPTFVRALVDEASGNVEQSELMWFPESGKPERFLGYPKPE